MRAERPEYRGFLYAGLMLTCDGPKVIEFNVRFGDPEAQVVIPMIDGDLAPRLAAAADGALEAAPSRSAWIRHVGVVLAAQGYPAGGGRRAIHGLDAASDWTTCLCFTPAPRGAADVGHRRRPRPHRRRSRTDLRGGDRASVHQASRRSTFDGMQYRRDIGRKAVLDRMTVLRK